MIRMCIYARMYVYIYMYVCMYIYIYILYGQNFVVLRSSQVQLYMLYIEDNPDI